MKQNINVKRKLNNYNFNTFKIMGRYEIIVKKKTKRDLTYVMYDVTCKLI